MNKFKAGLVLALLCTACAAPSSEVSSERFSADVWADNWFALFVDGVQVFEDSVPITTERSFNAESFEFSATRPAVLGLIAKDFKENDTGLEYIGTRRQQMGDGGVILQIRNDAGETVVVSNSNWKCLVVHKAPLDSSCVQASEPVAGVDTCAFEVTSVPDGWDTAGFDDSDWTSATVHTKNAVSPKFGYERIEWDPSAEFIWGPDLKKDNTVLCRLTLK